MSAKRTQKNLISENSGFKISYLAICLGLMVLGFLGWIAVYGLIGSIVFKVPGVQAVVPYGFSWFEAGLYLVFGLGSGFVVGRNSPSQKFLHAASAAVLFALLWFRSDATRYAPYFFILMVSGIVAGAIGAWSGRATLPEPHPGSTASE